MEEENKLRYRKTSHLVYRGFSCVQDSLRMAGVRAAAYLKAQPRDDSGKDVDWWDPTLMLLMAVLLVIGGSSLAWPSDPGFRLAVGMPGLPPVHLSWELWRLNWCQAGSLCCLLVEGVGSRCSRVSARFSTTAQSW